MARLLIESPSDVLGLVLYQLPLAHDIARTGLTCHALCDAAKLALKARPFSGEVVMLTHGSTCVAAAPDGRIITGSLDNTIKVWRDGTCERDIQDVEGFEVVGADRLQGAHAGDVNTVAVLPCGTRVVSGSCDCTVRLWTLGGALERSFKVGSKAFCIAALPDGVHFAVGTSGPTREVGFAGGAWLYHDGEVRMYHVDGTLVHTFKGHTGYVWAVAVTPDGQHVISGSGDRLVKVWSVSTKSLVSTCAGHTEVVDEEYCDGVHAVAAMPDGKRFLSGAADKTVRVWRLNGTHQNTFDLHTRLVNALVALPDNQHALSGSKDKTVKLFNVNNGAVLRTFTHHTSGVDCLALLPDGLRFVSGSWNDTARIVYHGLAPH